MIRFYFLLLLLPFAAAAQETSPPTAPNPTPAGKGVRFQEKLSWSAIRAKAKAENKYIFMDCFTTWCGPCRYMATTIFPTQEAGDYMNDKFISAAVQLDTTGKDNAPIRSWYADAHALMTQYNINAFPTYLVFSPDGQPVHRLLGSTRTAGEFITSMAACFDSTKQYYTLLHQYREGRRDSSFLRSLAQLSDDLYDLRGGKEIAEAYFATQTNLYTPAALHLIVAFTQTTKDPGFPVLNEHGDQVDAVLGAGKAVQSVGDILMKEFVNPAVKAAGSKTPDWTAIQTAMSEHFPIVAPEITAKARVLYYKRRQDWTHFLPAIKTYMEQYGAHASSQELNDYAYTVFESCPDMSCVAEALEWSKRSFKDQPDASYMDTYAEILYKLGRKDEAIVWEQKALDLAGTNDKSDYQQTIGKMKKGEKTWN